MWKKERERMIEVKGIYIKKINYKKVKRGKERMRIKK